MRHLALALVLVTICAPAVGARVLDAFVARIDDGVVTWSEVIQEVEIRRASGEPESLTEPRVVREALVRRRLLAAEAKKLRIEVDPGETAAAVSQLADRGGDDFWSRIRAAGLARQDLLGRARHQILVREYLDLRREMTFVPEADLRSFYAEQADVLGRKPLAEIRDDVRVYLAEKKYQKELDEWIDRQVLEGRVQLIPLPE